MVFFNCEACNETLKKNQVEKHIYKCHSPVSCIDCSVTFYGNDYNQHISCISEAEKYEKSLYKGKKTKLNPQDAWIAIIEDAASTSLSKAPNNIQQYVKRLAELGNVPRNAKKFNNFIKNSLRISNDSIITQIWTFLDSLKPPVEIVVPSVIVSSIITDDTDVIDDEKKVKKEKKEKRSREEVTVVEEAVEAEETVDIDSSHQEKKSKKHKKDKKDKKEKKDKKNKEEM